jgi:hypothetical protein
MINNLPMVINILFVLITILTVFLFYKASRSNTAMVIIAAWLILQAVIAFTGFYEVTTGFPPRFALLAAPAILFIIILFIWPKGKAWLDGLDTKTLTLLHIVRIPVELTLYWLFLQKTVPQIMTFAGRNYDIIAGLTAPIVYYFGFVRNNLSKTVLLVWNILCIGLLANIVITAVLSAPTSFQQFGFDQPNIAILYFPFVWLPCCVVPLVLLAHLVCIRRLLMKK